MHSSHRRLKPPRRMAGLGLALSLFTLLPLSGHAAGAEACTVKSRSERVVVVVCPKGQNQDQLRAAGTAACKGNTGGCNAWIWDDASKAPTKAPAVDADMPKATAGSARAVWLNDSQSLMELRKAP